jgi:regulator of replication initiation timing
MADIAAALNESESQAALATQNGNPQQSATVTNDYPRSFLFGSPSSQASTIGEWEEISPQDDPGQGGPSSSADQSLGNLDPRTPKKARITPMEQRSGVQIPFPLTPPQTIRRPHSSDQDIFQTDFPQTPTRNKGKERENSGGEQTTSGANARVPGPLESGSSIERAFDIPARTSNTLQRTSSNPFIVDQTIGESIASHLEALDALKSPSYIRKMEKKLSALEQSNKFKAKYLEDLKAAKAEAESENARLIAENTGLQSENARLTLVNARLQERLLQSEHSSRVKDIEIAAIKSRRPPNM